MRCAVQPLPFERALAAVSYDGHARRFLLRAKNGQRPEILRALAEQLSIAVALSGIARSVDAVVPVPGTFLARLRRGFDPALIIAEHVAYAVGAPLWKQALARRGPSGPPAKAMSARARWAGAGRNVRARRDVVDATLLLVDDVLTTGATAAACASALHMAGAAEVRIAVWARTPAPGPSFADSTQKHV